MVLDASPALTGTPTAPTAAAGTNTTQLATTAFVTNEVTALNTLAAGTIYLGNASNVATEVTLTGDVTIDNAGVSTIGTSKVVSSMITDATIVNADVNASAAIAGTKIAPDFGSQNISTTGNATVGGTLAITGVTTLTAQPVLSSLSVSLPVFTNGSKGLVSNPITGTGSVVLDASPALTGVPTAPTADAATNTTQLATTAFVTAAASSSKFVDLTTAQTVAGIKTFSSDVSINGITVGKGRLSVGHNTAIGNEALFSNTTGDNNTANGYQALYSNTTGETNTANGMSALYNNTTGSYNTANGYMALSNNTSGKNNTANGTGALYSNTEGNYNTANGMQALYMNNGSFNTANGYNAGMYSFLGLNSISSNSVYLGASTKAFASGDNNEIVIGYDATGAGSNTVTLGNTAILNVKTFGTITAGAVTYPNTDGTTGKVLTANGSGTPAWVTPTTGTVTSVTGTAPVLSSGGSTPVISIPAATNAVDGYATSAQIAAIEANTAKFTNATHTGDAEGATALIVKKINGVALSGLATGILKNTTTTGVPSIAVAGIDYLSPTSGWSLSGNSGSSSDYIGTTNDKALVYKVNSQKAGEVSSGGNTSFGYQTLNANTGTYNTAIGKMVLYSNTSGQYNTAIGDMALYINTTGYNNTANGAGALKSNTEGYYNTANGVHALYYNTTGSFNTANGAQALFSNTTGTSNTANGFQALYANTGTSNTANGYRAGNYISDGASANATSSQSVYLGASTKALASGDNNEIVIGYDATGAGSNTVTLGNTSVTSVNTSGSYTGGSFVKSGGTSSEFLKANGTVDGTAYAPLASPIFTGTPTLPTGTIGATQTAGNTTTALATTEFVTTALAGIAAVREVADEFTATAAQTSFTLTQTKSTNSVVKMYINGIRISNTAYGVSGTTLTYVPANNGAYALSVSDRVQFDYYY